jgi:hypothetical protein
MQGTVNKINYNGKAYSAQVDNEWYGAGFDQPKFSEGDTIEFNVEQRGKFKNLQYPKVLGSAVSGSSGGSTASAPEPRVDTRNISIVYQSSRKDAIEFVAMLLANQAVPLPTKKSDQADAIKALVEDYASQFYIRVMEVVEAGGCTIEDMADFT